jgi:hypothetical protein
MTLRIALITLFISLLNFGYAAIVVWFLRRRLSRLPWLEAAIWLWAFVMAGMFILEIVEPLSWKPFLRNWLYFPLATERVWNLLMLQVLFLALTFAALTVNRLRPVAPLSPLPPDGISRRKFLYLAACGTAPAVAIGMGVHGTLSRDDLRVRELHIPIAGLPPELEGFRIAHVSDLHSGLFVGPKRLRKISDMTNDLKPDLVAITGDIVNQDMSEFPDALAAIQRIESPHGIYLCEGNHDVYVGDGLFAKACAQNNLPFLYNSSAALEIGQSRLLLGGLPWMSHGFEGRPEIVRDLFPPRQPGDVRVLLAHHPNLFDIAADTDLVLTGHTHGGQIMLGSVGLGPLFFKYWSGPYTRGNTTMVVSNGCGDWFPCRVGAPAEVALLRLTAA